LGTLLLPSAAARAQTSNSGAGIGASQTLSQPAPQPTPSDTFPQVEHLFGDWGGVRTDLGRLGIDVQFSYTSETAGNVSGSMQRDLGYSGRSPTR
jgi:carbohydrate-selective porin OprB